MATMGYSVVSAIGYVRPHWGAGGGGSYYALDPAIVAAIVIGSLLLPMIIFFFVWRGLRGKFRKEQQLLATGTPGKAHVLSFQPVGRVMTINTQRLIGLSLSLEVHLPGRAPYPVQAQKYVSELYLASIQPGAWLDVRVNPSNPNELGIAGVASAPAQGAAPP
jgi:hypothetical protein